MTTNEASAAPPLRPRGSAAEVLSALMSFPIIFNKRRSYDK
jgi:hypothetical protein